MSEAAPAPAPASASNAHFAANVRRFADDPAYLNALVDATARMLGDLLSIKNPEIENGRITLGQCLYSLKDNFPSRETLDLIEMLSWALEFCEDTYCLCAALDQLASDSDSVMVRPLVNHRPYYYIEHFHRTRGSRKSHMKVGGIGARLSTEAEKLAVQWLNDCDRAMCTAFNDFGTHANATAAAAAAVANGNGNGNVTQPEELVDLIQNLAISIADHATAMDIHMSSSRRLCGRMLEARALDEFERTRKIACEDQHTDLIVLDTFLAVAKYGVQGEGGRAVIERLMKNLRYIVKHPPIELHQPSINLELLACAVGEDVDIDVRISTLNHWQRLHGASAAAAASEAIDLITRWDHSRQKPFIGVLCNKPGIDPPHYGATRMPRLGFLGTTRHDVWHFKQCPRRRTGLDFVGRRIVRLTSLVWELIGHGEIRTGDLGSHVVPSVTTQAILETKVVAAMLTQKLESCSIGEVLRKFTEDVSDSSSHLSDQVGHAMCSLGKFSELSIASAFHHKSPILPLLQTELTDRARRELLFHMPAQYYGFAVDALAIALPILKTRRGSIGISPWRASGPLADLLRTVPRVREWNPLRGCLMLTNDDFHRASPLTQQTLRKMSDMGTPLVKWKRPYGGGGRSKTKMAFVFDTPSLLRLLSVE
jgi:hypothetical protein